MDVTYDALKTYACTKCHAHKPLTEFSPSMLKDWLRRQPNYFRWVCYDCQYPLCKLCVESNDPVLQRRRPRDAIKHNALIDNVYYCQEHKYPRCSGILCSELQYAERKTRIITTKNRFKTWSCDECKQASSDMASRSTEKEYVSCKICRRCQKSLREVDFDKDSSHHLYNVCRACQHPTCAICGTTRESIWTPHPKVEKPVALCDVCERRRPCARCKRRLDLDAFDRSSSGHLYKHCRECQYPVCDRCGQRRKSIWTPNPKAPNAVPLCEACERKSAKRRSM